MRGLRRVLATGAGVGLLVVGCAAASHLQALQPAHAPTSPPLTIPSSRTETPMQRGIDLDAYTYPGQDIAAAARADIAYITSLHANAVLISFPFFVNGQYGSRAYAKNATPTPAQVAVIVRDAQRAETAGLVAPAIGREEYRDDAEELGSRQPNRLVPELSAIPDLICRDG